MGGRGSGGSNRKSDAIKVLEGNRGHRKMQASAETATQQKQSIKLPTCPGWLNSEAKREWRRVCSKLAEKGILDTVDRSILAGYCSAYARWRLAEEFLNDKRTPIDSGLTQLARHGMAPRPEVKIARESLQQMRALAAELGLTPKARNSVGSHEGKTNDLPQDPLDKALGTQRMN